MEGVVVARTALEGVAGGRCDGERWRAVGGGGGRCCSLDSAGGRSWGEMGAVEGVVVARTALEGVAGGRWELAV